MSLLLDLLRQIGVGGNVLLAAGLIVGALYLVRGKRLASTAVTATASATVYGVVLLVAGAIAIALGWIEPNPGLIADGVDTALSPLADVGGDVLAWLLRKAAEAVSK